MPRYIAPLLAALRRAADFIEAPETARAVQLEQDAADEANLARRNAAIALAWSARQLRAIVLLLENGAALEAEPIIRTLLENALTVAWVGSDSERAQQFRDDGLRSMRTWMDAMKQQTPGLFSQEALAEVQAMLDESTGKRLPNIQTRAEQARPAGLAPGLTQRAYHFSYRRLSASVHSDSRFFDLLLNETDSTEVLDARDTAIAAYIMVASAGACLGITSIAMPVAADLLASAKERVHRITSPA